MLEISPDRICPESRWAVCFLCSLNAANEFGLHTSQEIKGCFWDLISIHSPALEMGHSGDKRGSLANSLDSRQWWGRQGEVERMDSTLHVAP